MRNFIILSTVFSIFLILTIPIIVLAQIPVDNEIFIKGDLEGPDFIPPPKHYKTLDMMLAEAGLGPQLVGPPPVPVTGTREILVILVELSDVAHGSAHTVNYFRDRFFDTSPPSVRDYFDEVSYGNFTFIPGAVLGWYSSTYNQNQWANVDKRPVVVEAIQDVDADFNFSTYDTNNDGIVTNEELTLFIIVSGNQGGASHWYTTSSVSTADGVSVEGEFCNTHEEGHIGSYCHELGHDLGLPDLYDTDPQTNGSMTTGLSEGIGEYGLMGGGSWTFSHMTAWSKIQLGWITATVVTTSGYYDVHDAETNAEAYILVDGTHSNDEYFLIENRHPANSYYETIGPPVAPGGTYPDSGIVIYHIDETRVQDWINNGTNNVNVDETHKGVDVETAEDPSSHFMNADDLDAENNRGDLNDLWDQNEYDFNDVSIPCNAHWYGALSSNMGVCKFPAVGPTMRIFFSILDNSVPSAPGTPTDEGQFVGDTDVTFNWTPAADNESCITNYHLQVGTVPGGNSEFDNWIGDVLTYTLSGRTHCQTLYARVRAMNCPGLIGPWSGNSDGIAVDLTPPTAPGTPIDDGIWTNNPNVTFNWTAATDDKSGITGYYLQVGTSPEDNSVFDGPVGNVLTFTVTGSHCQTLYARVRAKNGAGSDGPWSDSSDGIGIDLTPPSAPGTPTDAGQWTISRNVTFDWTSATDDKSGIEGYYLQVGTTPEGNDKFNGWVGNVLTYTITGSAGETLYARVKAKNGAETEGDWSESSDGITILAVDILFSFDLGCNMADDLGDMKLAANSIVDHLQTINSDAFYGVVSFVDYCICYSSDDYSAQYGDDNLGDYPWHIDQSLTTDPDIAKDAVDALCTYGGCDIPQDYTRAMLECLFLNWRPDARKFLIMIGNAPAHDVDFFSTCYGIDPGPDADIETCDDLDYETVVNWVHQAGLTIISIDNGTGTAPTPDTKGDTWKNFDYMATETGGYHAMKPNWADIPNALETLGALGPKHVTAYPWIEQAEAMKFRDPLYGNSCEDGWRMTHRDHPICNGVVFLTDGLYHVTITAKAEIDRGAAPWLKVQIGDAYEGTCEITSPEWEDYAFVTDIPAGFHPVSLTYLNDYWVENVGDRNLLLDKVVITPHIGPSPTMCYTFEAEEMRCQIQTQPDPSGDFAMLYKEWSYVAHDMYFERQNLHVDIYAKGDSVAGAWPKMDVYLDDIKMTNDPIPVESAINTPYPIDLTDIQSGKHRIKIAYHRDAWAYERNLYIDKIVICTEGGFLRPISEPPMEEETTAAIPETFALEQNYPNPFNPDTYINYQLAEDSYVVITILNTLGQKIRTLVSEFKSAGDYTAQWNGCDDNGNRVVSGIYLYQMKAGNYINTKKMALLK